MNTFLRAARAIAILCGIALPATTAQQTYFFEDFSTPNSGWSLGNEWQIGPATASSGQSYGHADPAADADGVVGGGLAGIVIGGNAATTPHSYEYLTSPVIPLPNSGRVYLRFDRLLSSWYSYDSQECVEVWNGSSWTLLYASGYYPTSEFSWTQQCHDVTNYANAQFRVRFGRVVFSNTIPTASWSIDNVRVYSPTGGNLLNGGFEAGHAYGNYFTVSSSNGTVSNWTLNNVDIIASNFWLPSEGSHSIDLNGSNQGSIWQAFDIVPDRAYVVEFDQAGNPLTQSISQLTVAISMGAGTYSPFTSQSYTFDSTGATPLQMGWKRRRFTFIASFGTSCGLSPATLRFDSNTGGPNGPVIDNITVSEISGAGQANSTSAALNISFQGGGAGIPGPFVATVPTGTQFPIYVSGPPGMPFIVLASFETSFHSSFGCLGKLDLGTPPNFFDVFVILDGTTFPGSLFATIPPGGQFYLSLSTNGLPQGLVFGLQAIVAQPPGSACPYQFTTTHIVYLN